MPDGGGLLQVACLSGNETALQHCTPEELTDLETTLGTACFNLRRAMSAAQARDARVP